MVCGFQFSQEVLKREREVAVQWAKVLNVSNQMNETVNIVNQHVPPIQLSSLTNEQMEVLMCILRVTHIVGRTDKAVYPKKVTKCL